MFKSISLFLAIVCLQGVLSQRVSEGQCFQVKTVQDFDLKKFNGTWVGYAKVTFEFTNDLKCNAAVYDLTSAKPSLTNQGVRKSDNVPVTLDSWPIKEVTSGKFAVGYPGFEDLSRVNLEIIKTDYNNYAAAYSCQQVNATYKSETIFLVTRVRVPDPTYVDLAEEAYKNENIDTTGLTKNDQTNCPDLI